MSGTQMLQQYAESCEDQQNKTCLMNGKIFDHGEHIVAYKEETKYFSDMACSNEKNMAEFICQWGEIIDASTETHKNWREYPYFACQTQSPRTCYF